MTRLFVVVLAALLSGCIVLDGEVGATREDACTAVCDCLFFSPSSVRGCSEQCAADPDFLPQSETCFACLTENSCETLEAGGCNADCSAAPPPDQPTTRSGT